jgi:Methyltransferase domain
MSLKSIVKAIHPKYQNVTLEYKVNMRPRWGHGQNANTHLLAAIEKNKELYASYLTEFLTHKEVFHQIKLNKDEADENQIGWNNEFLPGLDIVSIYGMLAKYNPKKYIEIGSGHSTKVVRKAIFENDLQTKTTSIDPFPRANIDHLADNVVRLPIENMEDYSEIESLEENDILFIDNSHRCFPNSDVTVCFLELLPLLKKGVIVHVHDIYLPYDYPQFMCDRAYSEQYVLGAFILANPDKFKTICPNFYISEDAELSKILAPIWEHENLKTVERHGGSYWLQIS